VFFASTKSAGNFLMVMTMSLRIWMQNFPRSNLPTVATTRAKGKGKKVSRCSPHDYCFLQGGQCLPGYLGCVNEEARRFQTAPGL